MTPCKGGFIVILVANFYLSVAATGRWKHFLPSTLVAPRVENIVEPPKRVDTFFRARYGTWIQNGYCNKLAIIHAEPECSILLRYKLDWPRPLGLSWFDHIHCRHLPISCFSNFCVWGRAGNDAEWIGHVSDKSKSILCVAPLIWPKWLSQVCWFYDKNDINLAWYGM